MVEEGLVSKVKGKTVYVVLEKKAECETCKACVFGKKQRIKMPAISKIDCVVGDLVAVKMPEKSFVFASIFLYAIPIAFMLGGVLLGMLFNETVQIILAFAFLTISCAGIWFIDKFYFRKKAEYNPVITGKIALAGTIETSTKYQGE